MKDFFSNFLVLSHWQSAVVLAILCVIFYILRFLDKRKIDFSIRTFVGLVAGVVFGFLLQYINPQSIWLDEVRVWFGFLGNTFLGFIKMLVLPIVGISIIKVLLEVTTQVRISALLSRAFFWILFTVGLATLVGLFLGISFGVGDGMQTSYAQASEIRQVQNLPAILSNLIPSNIIETMGKNNIIAYVIFCFFIGFGAYGVRNKAEFKAAYSIFESCVQVVYQIVMDITLFIVRFMPYAVVCMMSEVILENGFEALKSAGNFIILIYVAMVIMFVIHFILIAINGLNPFTYVKKAFYVWMFAFSSRSSVGTLPLTISCLQEKLGVSKAVANFTASIGTTVGLNGCAGYFPALAVVFVAHSLGVEIGVSFVVAALFVAVLGSLGIAGVPGSATMAASIMLTGMGFSEHFVMLSIILAIDPIIDMARTASNVSGAMVSSICADKNLGTLDIKTYNKS